MAWFAPMLLLLSGPVLFLSGRRMSRRSCLWAVISITATALVLTLLTIRGDWHGAWPWSDDFILSLGLSPLASLFLLTIALVAPLITAFATFHEEERGLRRQVALLLVFTAAMELLVLADDLLTLLIAWELVGACSWALISQQWWKREPPGKALHVFLVVRLGDLGLFVAAFTAFAATGSFSYSGLSQLEGFSLQLFTLGIVVAAAAKSAQLPFSPWLFAAMAGPVSVSALLHAATMVAAGIYLLVRLHSTLDQVDWFAPLIMTLGLGTALAAGVVASLQSHVKKLLAASTSAHFGLMWLAAGAGYPAVAALHFTAHAFMKAALFLLAGVAAEAAGSFRLGRIRLRGQVSQLRWASLIAGLALAGMFPLGAAWSKEKIITAAGHVDPGLALLAMLAGALCGLYAARFHGGLFARSGTDSINHYPSLIERSVIYGLVAISLLLAVLWWPALSDLLAQLLSAEIPPFKLWEVSLSLLLVAAGIAWGYRLSGQQDLWQAQNAERWFGLASGARFMLWDGLGLLALLADRLDRHWDAGVDYLGSNVRGRIAGAAARLDLAGIDRAYTGLAVLSAGAARFGARAVEWLFDQIPEGSGRATGYGGHQVRRMQTGLSHHYYIMAVAGGCLFLFILLIGALL